MTIPEILVVGCALVSAVFIWKTRAMPWRMRISLMIPRLFFAAIYFLPISSTDRISFVLGGLIAQFIIEVIVASISAHHRRRSIWQLNP